MFTKNRVAVFGVALVIGSAGSSLANNHGGSGGSAAPVAPAVHRAAPTISGPHLNGMPAQIPGMSSYRPVVTYHGSTRTLNYPAVRNSILGGQPIHSNAVSLNTGRALQHSGSVRRSSHPNTIQNHPLDPQTSARLRNWKGNVSSAQQAHLNNQNNFQHHHDHDWWRHHCAEIIFFDFGWWGWWDGWWYPAWGYDPYSYYEYNQPIYGYGGESPEQIIANVQTALQEQGYYQYAVDGRMGPLTRSALNRYQRDHGLSVTSEIDPATLGSLGVIR
jgi:Putative peptidoglycan binding domain